MGDPTLDSGSEENATAVRVALWSSVEIRRLGLSTEGLPRWEPVGETVFRQGDSSELSQINSAYDMPRAPPHHTL